jgi:hypothetical protein
MRKSYLVMGFIYAGTFAVASAIAACDSEQNAQQTAESTKAILSSPVNTTPSDSVDKAVLDNEGPSLPVVMRWVDIKPGETATTDTLYLEVENVSRFDFILRARLICHGLLKMKEYLDVKGFNLPAGDKVMLQVPADEMPIQTTVGAAQARMEILLNRIKDGAEDARQLRYLTPAINYRHGSGYKDITLFDDAALMKQHGGMLSGTSAGIKSLDEVMGRVTDSKGGFRDVTLSDETFMDKNGARVLGIRIGNEPPGTNTNPDEIDAMEELDSKKMKELDSWKEVQ